MLFFMKLKCHKVHKLLSTMQCLIEGCVHLFRRVVSSVCICVHKPQHLAKDSLCFHFIEVCIVL